MKLDSGLVMWLTRVSFKVGSQYKLQAQNSAHRVSSSTPTSSKKSSAPPSTTATLSAPLSKALQIRLYLKSHFPTFYEGPVSFSNSIDRANNLLLPVKPLKLELQHHTSQCPSTHQPTRSPSSVSTADAGMNSAASQHKSQPKPPQTAPPTSKWETRK